jgi:hypothetical protein
LRAGYFTIDDNEARSIDISPPRRLAASGIAIGALALGFAVPARADDVTPPVPPDTAGAAALATAVQTAASNVNVSIRIGSPGDAGAVTQTIATAVAAAAQAAEPPATPSPAPPTAAAAAVAAATQTAPANLDVSVRIASPGNEGPTTQTIKAGTGADAQTQYQPPSDQYQPQQPAAPTTESAPPATESEPAVTQAPPAPSAIAAPSATTPVGWTWNWTWTCGDITSAGTTQTIDTGISGWVWNWKLADTCVAPPISQPAIDSVIPPKSSADIYPAPPMLPGPAPPVLPVLPVLPVPPVPPIPPMSPTPPAVVPPAAPIVEVLPPALVEIVELAPSALEIDPSDRIAAIGADAPFDPGSAGHHPVAPRDTTTSRALPPAPFERSVSAPSPVNVAPAASRASQERPVHRPTALRLPTPLSVAGAAAPASGGGSSAGSSAAAALALWFLLQFPGLAVLRLPRSMRSPRSRVDDPSTRPG